MHGLVILIFVNTFFPKNLLMCMKKFEFIAAFSLSAYFNVSVYSACLLRSVFMHCFYFYIASCFHALSCGYCYILFVSIIAIHHVQYIYLIAFLILCSDCFCTCSLEKLHLKIPLLLFISMIETLL